MELVCHCGRLYYRYLAHFKHRILNTHFQAEISTLQYSINPEVHLASGFTDLLVTLNDFNPPSVYWQIIFEGKAGNGMNYANTLNQLDGYAQEVYGQRGWCYLIAARGRTCMFWRYQKWHMCPIQPMGVDPNGNVAFITQARQIPLPLSEEYDLINDQNIIATLLQYITNNPHV